ncbi:TIGR03936 family radical SAM-associated protein [Ruminococcaceae bacterium OttesenSCG-928-L11]|nr:TIGR03936 family radical SAM-associated protein [Ruminococcaceae bacterium OttesenSCG-928-L11]
MSGHGQFLKTVRIFYSKTARAKYVSHLDTMRTITRALRRSRVPLWYTEGFNPHLYLTFALPLSLGYEGQCESFDVRLTAEMDLDTLTKRINAAMPMGFEVLRAAEPVMEPKAIVWADYQIRLLYAPADREHARQSFEVFDSQPVIEVQKKTKKGEKMVDIRPLVQTLSAQWGETGVALTLRIASGITTNINPTLYLKAFYQWANREPEGVRVVRTAILDENLREFC